MQVSLDTMHTADEITCSAACSEYVHDCRGAAGTLYLPYCGKGGVGQYGRYADLLKLASSERCMLEIINETNCYIVTPTVRT